LYYINNISASQFFKKTLYSITYKTLIIKGFAFDLFPGEHLPIPAINLLRKFICESRIKKVNHQSKKRIKKI
jgi:hypothetical protein